MSEASNLEVENEIVDSKPYISERGPFEINPAQEWKGPYPVGTFDGAKVVRESWDISKLVEDGNEDADEVCEKLGEMLELAASGSSENRLMRQDEGFENGFRATHVWFGPNFHLFRHSHAAGDCTYLVMAGELTMGNRTLKAGSTVFVPNQMPYKFVAGPDGVEVVEFRSGGRIPGKAGMRIEETSLKAVQKIIDDYNANSHLWKAPPTFSDTGHVKPHLES
tara:strand:- start:49 stop:714 length:666 start_codon:yes stop_codon:yes gene_type:complete